MKIEGICSEPPKALMDQDESRRNLMLAAVSLGLAGLVARAESQATIPDPSADWASPTGRLLRRITYCPLPEEVSQAQLDGFITTRDRQLSWSTINDSATELVIGTKWPRLAMSTQQLFGFSDDWVSIQHLGEALLYRAIHSKRQLRERMVEFWLDHFNVHMDKTPGWTLVPFERDVIRPNALGTFPNLLRAVAHSPAMLIYLDNTENHGEWGNINYARELLELHTMSSTGGYTADDIRQVQRCFSGWAFRWEPGHPEHGNYQFWDWAHAGGTKTVLGNTINPTGKSEGDAVLNILAAHPSTAQFISKKLCRFFLAYEPSQTLIDQVATRYLNTSGNIVEMLKIILTQANVTATKAKHKRPYHLMMGGMRAMKTQFQADQWSIRYEHLLQAGQLPYNWSPPDGYPDKLSFWASLILPRWNFALMLPQGYIWQTTVDIPALLGGASTPQAIADKISQLLCLGEMNADDKEDIRLFLAAKPIDQKRIEAAFAIGLASNSFQWY